MAKAGTPSVLDKLARFGQLSVNQKVAVLGGLLFLAVVLAGAWMYATAPTWRVLYTNLSDRDGGDIIAALSQMNIPYKTEDGGALMVPAGEVYEIRLKLASKGLPKGSTVGFELMDNEKLGTSQFIEQVDYQRALEGELTRSIESLSQIQGARVHLAIPAQSVFVRDQQKPTASVLVSLSPGQSLAPSQVEGIARLVASAVPGLTEDHVTVVDQNGNMLSKAAHDPADDGLDADQLDYRAQVEKQLARHIEAILAPLAGPDNVSAQVTADLDFSQTSQVSEQYQPNGTPTTAAIRSQQTQETTDGGTPAASGVPGAASNQPPGAKPAAAAKSAAAGPSSKNSVTNYEVDKTVREVKDAPGAIRRLSVAVVINDKKLVNRDGTTQSVPYSAAEMTQINNLVKEAMGFDAQRGDTVNVVNAAFDQPVAEPVEKTPFYRNPDTIALAETLGRDAAAIAVVVFVLLTVRRMILQIKLPEPPPPPATAAPESLAPSAPRPGVMAYEQAVTRAQEVARNDPAIVANVVKDWLGNE